MAGGVARNPAVMGHLQTLLDMEILVEDAIPLGAAGAGLLMLEEEWVSRAAGESLDSARTLTSFFSQLLKTGRLSIW